MGILPRASGGLRFLFVAIDTFTKWMEAMPVVNITQKAAVVDVSYAASQAHGIINVALHQEYSPGIIFIFSQWRKCLYHV
jgi:hypothetical protein